MKFEKPTLLINEAICRANIKKMAARANANKLKFRPHFKTHQSHAIGEWFKEEGVEAITVSSLGMAKYLADAGWQEITVAFPCNILQIDLINHLAENITLNLLVDNHEIIDLLDAQLKHIVNLYVEIDTGKGRTGVNVADSDLIIDLLTHIDQNSSTNVKGLYLHAGHSYDCIGKASIEAVYQQASMALGNLRVVTKEKFPTLEFCYGDTPTCSVIDKFENIDAMSPGNFVFYDVMQTQIGACSMNEIAVIVACPVVSINRAKHQVCIYGGAIHMSKDAIEEEGVKVYGKVVKVTTDGWSSPLENCYVSGLSQEHGLISMSNQELDKLKVGDVLGIVPIHSCLTAECLGEYVTTKGNILDHYAKKKHA
jgi:D-serine deaminase-like pyridoxal phosphate-dependent protein